MRFDAVLSACFEFLQIFWTARYLIVEILFLFWENCDSKGVCVCVYLCESERERERERVYVFDCPLEIRI